MSDKLSRLRNVHHVSDLFVWRRSFASKRGQHDPNGIFGSSRSFDVYGRFQSFASGHTYSYAYRYTGASLSGGASLSADV
jgi:hypothetical protein